MHLTKHCNISILWGGPWDPCKWRFVAFDAKHIQTHSRYVNIGLLCFCRRAKILQHNDPGKNKSHKSLVPVQAAAAAEQRDCCVCVCVCSATPTVSSPAPPAVFSCQTCIHAHWLKSLLSWKGRNANGASVLVPVPSSGFSGVCCGLHKTKGQAEAKSLQLPKQPPSMRLIFWSCEAPEKGTFCLVSALRWPRKVGVLACRSLSSKVCCSAPKSAKLSI